MAGPEPVLYRLGQMSGDGLHPYVGRDGAFLGCGTPLLEKDARGRWRPRPRAVLEKLLAVGYGAPCDLADRMPGLASLAGSLDRGEDCRAAIALLHLRLSPLPDLAAGQRMAKADALGKYNPDQPRVPAGNPGAGEWTTADGGAGGGNPGSDAGPRLAMSPECQEEWAQAYGSCRELEDKGMLNIPYSYFGRNYEECVRGMVTERCAGNPVG